MALGVDPGGGIRGVVRGARPFLQLGVVARRHRESRLRGQLPEQRLRQRRAFHRIGAGRDLVEKDKGVLRGVFEDPDEVANVRREGREAHRDGLLVADVDQDLVEDGKRRLVRRRPQAALVQDGGETQRLQRDGLAARVGSADYECSEGAELEVDGDGRPPVE